MASTPIYITQPSDATYKMAKVATALSAVAIGDGVMSYLWQESADGTTWGDIDAELTDENGTSLVDDGGNTVNAWFLIAPSTYMPDTMRYGTVYARCIALNTNGTQYAYLASRVATITITAPEFGIITQPENHSYYIGDETEPMVVMASADYGMISYQWSKSNDCRTWNNISGAISNQYYPSASEIGTIYYRCLVTNDFGDDTQSVYTRTVAINIGYQEISLRSDYPMNDLLLADGDLFLNGYDLALTNSIRQAIKIRLRWFSGEWIFQPDFGVKYYENVFIKNPIEERIMSMLMNALMGIDGVNSVENIEVTIDKKERVANISFEVMTDEGRIAEEVDVWTMA